MSPVFNGRQTVGYVPCVWWRPQSCGRYLCLMDSIKLGCRLLTMDTKLQGTVLVVNNQQKVGDVRCVQWKKKMGMSLAFYGHQQGGDVTCVLWTPAGWGCHLCAMDTSRVGMSLVSYGHQQGGDVTCVLWTPAGWGCHLCPMDTSRVGMSRVFYGHQQGWDVTCVLWTPAGWGCNVCSMDTSRVGMSLVFYGHQQGGDVTCLLWTPAGWGCHLSPMDISRVGMSLVCGWHPHIWRCHLSGWGYHLCSTDSRKARDVHWVHRTSKALGISAMLSGRKHGMLLTNGHHDVGNEWWFITDYKISPLCFGVLDSTAPSHLSDPLHVYAPSHQVRSSSDDGLFCVPHARTKSHGQRTFIYLGTTTWNQLPLSVRHSQSLNFFQNQTKTPSFPNMIRPQSSS